MAPTTWWPYFKPTTPAGIILLLANNTLAPWERLIRRRSVICAAKIASLVDPTHTHTYSLYRFVDCDSNATLFLCLLPPPYSDYKLSLMPVIIMIMIFFLAVNSAAKYHCFSFQHSWLKRSSNQLTYSWWSNHKLGDILLASNTWSRHFLSVIFIKFREYTWCAFVITMSVVFYRIDHSKKKSWKVTDQALVANITGHNTNCLSISPLIITIEYVKLTWILFQSDCIYDIDSDILQHWLKHSFLSTLWMS